MPNTPTQEEPDLPAWHFETQSFDTKGLWAEALDDYLGYHEVTAEDTVFSKQLVKECIPFVKKYDSRWKGFKADFFLTGKYKSCDTFYNVVRNRLDSLKIDEDKKRKHQEKVKAAALKAQQEKEAAQAEEEEPDEHDAAQKAGSRKSSRVKTNVSDTRSVESKRKKTDHVESSKPFEGKPSK